jgi:vacuolar-type H+-ATPase subunit H
LTFPEPVAEVICGDLYDTSTGKGLFVVQRSGDEAHPGNNVYLKPVASKGMSNLFVTTGDRVRRTYNFDLEIVPIAQAQRVVNVVDAQSGQSQAPGPDNGTAAGSDSTKRVTDRELEQRRVEIEQQARRQADEILRNARQQADRIVAEAEARVVEVDRQTLQRGEQEAERRFVQALILGLRETKINNPRTTVKKVTVLLDPRMLTFDDRSYLRYTIQNTSAQEFVFNSITLEKVAGNETQALTIEIHQSKAENKLEPGESLTGVISFEQKSVAPRERLVLFLRGEDNVEIGRVTIQ